MHESTLPGMAACLALQAFLFVPLTLYLSNLQEMNIAIGSVVKLCLIPALLLLLTIIGLSKALPKRHLRQFTVLIALLSILVWVQSNMLLWNYGLLDGVAIDWAVGSWRGYVDMAAWLGVLVVGMVWLQAYWQRIIQLAIGFVLLQALTLASLAFTHQQEMPGKNSADNEIALQQLYQFSKQQNVLHVVIDGFQADVFNDLMHDEAVGKPYREDLSGFVFYGEALGAFPYTRFSVPAFLSGKQYSNEMPQDEFVDKVLGSKNILNLATSKGFELDLGISSPYLESRYSHAHHQNLYNFDDMNSTQEEVAKLLDLSLFRIAPHFIKPLVYNNQKWLLAPLFAGQAGMQFNYFKHTLFLNNFMANMAVGRAAPVYKFLHVMNTHNPMVVNAQCQYVGRAIGTTRASLTAQSKCTLDTVVRLFTKMKELGIYDDSLIVMHGDHGGWAANHRKNPSIKFPTGAEAPEWVASLASPMLAIKLPRATGALTISTVQASLMDLPDTISDIMQWQTDFGHDSLLTLDPAVSRERRFRFYAWRENEWSAEYAGPIQEYIIQGSHYDSPWKLGPLLLPPEVAGKSGQ
jgi:hypothetical protein